jgi:hypothetical protein
MTSPEEASRHVGDDTNAEIQPLFFALSSHFLSMKMTLSSTFLRLFVFDQQAKSGGRGTESGRLPRISFSRGVHEAVA